MTTWIEIAGVSALLSILTYAALRAGEWVYRTMRGW